MNSVKYNEKIINFISRFKYAEQKVFCNCIEIYQLYEGEDYDKIHEVSSTLKNKNLKGNSILIEIYKYMLENPDFEQNHLFKNSNRYI